MKAPPDLGNLNFTNLKVFETNESISYSGNFPGDHLVELELELEELEELEELADLVGSKMLTFSNP